MHLRPGPRTWTWAGRQPRRSRSSTSEGGTRTRSRRGELWRIAVSATERADNRSLSRKCSRPQSTDREEDEWSNVKEEGIGRAPSVPDTRRRSPGGRGEIPAVAGSSIAGSSCDTSRGWWYTACRRIVNQEGGDVTHWRKEGPLEVSARPCS